MIGCVFIDGYAAKTDIEKGVIVVYLLYCCIYPISLIQSLLHRQELMLHELPNEIVIKIHFLLNSILLDKLDILLE